MFEIRCFNENDSVEELTELLHRSYKKLADMGLNFLATYQDAEMTKKRLKKGECFCIKNNDSKLIASISFYNHNKSSGCLWYRNEDTAYFGQFAVEPEMQKKGIGGKLLEFVENYAKEKGIKELALDTSEKAVHLIEYYKGRGYRFIQYHQWDIVNYRSVVLSKTL